MPLCTFEQLTYAVCVFSSDIPDTLYQRIHREVRERWTLYPIIYRDVFFFTYIHFILPAFNIPDTTILAGLWSCLIVEMVKVILDNSRYLTSPVGILHGSYLWNTWAKLFDKQYPFAWWLRLAAAMLLLFYFDSVCNSVVNYRLADRSGIGNKGDEIVLALWALSTRRDFRRGDIRRSWGKYRQVLETIRSIEFVYYWVKRVFSWS